MGVLFFYLHPYLKFDAYYLLKEKPLPINNGKGSGIIKYFF